MSFVHFDVRSVMITEIDSKLVNLYTLYVTRIIYVKNLQLRKVLKTYENISGVANNLCCKW